MLMYQLVNIIIQVILTTITYNKHTRSASTPEPLSSLGHDEAHKEHWQQLEFTNVRSGWGQAIVIQSGRTGPVVQILREISNPAL